MLLRRVLLGAVVMASLVACAGTASDDTSASDDAVTGTLETAVRDQEDTGNCWLFATAAWAESLELGAMVQNGQANASDKATYPAHLSPAYWDYWDWYTKITTGAVKAARKDTIEGELDSGGSWGAAVEIIARYGMVRTNAFLGPGANKDAATTTSALGAITTSLLTGALETVSSRGDKALVRQELNRAFGLESAVVAKMDAAFGADGASSLRANSLVIAPGAYEVRLPIANGTYRLLPITEAIGTRAPGTNPDQRVGDLAWNVVPFKPGTAEENRAYFQRVQRALAMNVPLPISWYVASNGDPDADGEYTRTPIGAASQSESGDHETLLDDYDVSNVPGYGHLAAGTTATVSQKTAALDEHATINFLRVKNSWGTAGKSVAPKGYNDLSMDYLVKPVTACPRGAVSSSPKCKQHIPLEDITLPAGF